MDVSVIATIKNEGDGLRPMLESLIGQTRAAEEVVICDGGSTDNSLKILEEYRRRLPLSVISAPGSNISQGRNRAISAASGPIIAATDAGVILDPQWLAEIVRPIEERGAPVVSGWFQPDPRSRFELIMGATVLPDLSDIRPQEFLPSSRSIAFQKKAWLAAGKYPEWLDYGEDLIFDLALRERFGPFPFASGAVAYFRPRSNLLAFVRQYYLYARGDGKANLWLERHTIRYLTYVAGLPLIGSLILRGKKTGWLLLLTGVAAYCRRPIQRLWPSTKGWSLLDRAGALALVPAIRLVGDVAKMGGYPVGVIWRWRNRNLIR